MDSVVGNLDGKRLSQDNNTHISSNGELENGGLIKRTSVKSINKTDEVSFDQLEFQPSGCLQTTLARVGGSTEDFLKKNQSSLNIIFLFILNGLVVGFFFGCLYYWIINGSAPLELCNGFGSLIAFLTIVYGLLFYFLIVKKYFGAWFRRNVWIKVESFSTKAWEISIFRYGFLIAILAAVGIFLYVDTDGNANRLISLLGLFIILLLGFTFSKHPGRINWRSVLVGLGIQFVFGLLFIRWPTGRAALQCFSDKKSSFVWKVRQLVISALVESHPIQSVGYKKWLGNWVATFLSYGVEGAAFVYGDLLVRTEAVFGFSTLPVIFFFSMLVEVLFFWGALQWFCRKLGGLLQYATGTTVCESVIAVGNVFLGMTESALLVKPYMSVLTPSEIHVIMASGFATVSGTILAAYIGFGVEPAHLVTSSVMSAPAAICYAKLLMPETKRSLTTVDNLQPYKSEDRSALSAATRGAGNGTFLLLNVIANLIAFVSCIALINGVLGYCGGLLGNPELNLEWILGKIFIPLCWVMGVPWEECELVGSLIGLKTVVNEFVAYERMGTYKKQGLLSERAELIATYSLCGFTNPSSAGIMIGALSAMAPNQREVLSSVALRAFFAGCGICFMTACIAGLLMPDGSFS